MPVRPIFETSWVIRKLPIPLRYGLATLIVLLFAGLRWAMEDLLGPVPFLLFFPAVLLIALILDHGTAIYASFLSVFLSVFLFIPPKFSLAVSDARLAFAALLTLLILLLLAWLVENLRDKTQSLARLEKEQRFLRTEMHHRVKNGLQLLTAILHLEAGRDADPRTRNLVQAVSHRIMVISRVHERLYRSELQNVVNAKDFVDELCRDLQMSFVEGRTIALRVRAQPVVIELDKAVPFGLIVNELMTNALKHAFPDERPGTIAVDFARDGDVYVLQVSDDGIGDPALGRSDARPRLVEIMVRQMGGRIEVSREEGFRVRIEIPVGADVHLPAA